MSATRWPSWLNRTRLLEREPRFAAAGATTDLDALQHPRGVEQDRLLLGQPVDSRLMLGGRRDQVGLRVGPAMQDLAQVGDVGLARARLGVLLPVEHVPQLCSESRQVVPSRDRPPRTRGSGKAVVDVGERQNDCVRPADATPVPALVVVGVLTRRIHPVARLTHRVDHPAAVVPRLRPLSVRLTANDAALDLEDDEAVAGKPDQEVELVVLPAVGEPQVGNKEVVLVELAAQALPHDTLAVGGEDRRICRHHGLLSPRLLVHLLVNPRGLGTRARSPGAAFPCRVRRSPPPAPTREPQR